MIRISTPLLQRAMQAAPARAALFAEHLDAACTYYGISASMQRLAIFLAQIGTESGSLVYVREIADGSAYEGRADLGNTQPGDGRRFRGRGLIQLTGRANAQRIRDRLRARLGPRVPDFEVNPEALEQPEWAAWSAADYWDMRGLNVPADRDDFILVTRRINGGTNGLADRQRRWEHARAVLAELVTAEPAPVVERSVPASPPADKTTTPPAAPAQEQTMPVPALLTALASTAINLFTPVAAAKLRKEMDRHTDDPAVADQIVTGVIQAVKTATGQEDPIQAVAAVQADPLALQQAEAGALQALDQLLPLLEKLNAMEQANLKTAREFNAAEPLFLDFGWLRLKFVHLLSLVFVGFSGTFVLMHWASLTSELKGSVMTLMVIAGFAGVRDYWMGSSSGSDSKNAVMAAMAGRRGPPQR